MTTASEFLNDSLDKASVIISPPEAWPLLTNAMERYSEEGLKEWKEKTKKDLEAGIEMAAANGTILQSQKYKLIDFINKVFTV